MGDCGPMGIDGTYVGGLVGVTTDHSGAGVDERGTGGGTWEV